MNVQFTAKEYSVALTNFKQPYGFIMLFDEAGKWRARLNFSTLPEITETTKVAISGDFIEVSMNIQLMAQSVDLLRNENPVTATVDSDYGVFILSTGKEPVGEEEASRIRKISASMNKG